MTTMLLYQNENLLIDFHYTVYGGKSYSTQDDVWTSFIHTNGWSTISVMVNWKLRRVTEQIDVNISEHQSWSWMSSFDIIVEDEDWKEYRVSIEHRDVDTILRAFAQIGYDIDTPPIYKNMRDYIEKVTRNYLNPQYQKPLPQ